MFGDKLRELRKGSDLSMEELTKKYNEKFNGRLNKSTLSRYENNLQEPMVNVAINLSSFFNISLDQLIDESYSFNSKKMKTNPIFSTEETQLIENYRCLNQDGQEKAIDYISDLVDTGKYKKHNQANMDKKQA